jgi:hypothetical protein
MPSIASDSESPLLVKIASTPWLLTNWILTSTLLIRTDESNGPKIVDADAGAGATNPAEAYDAVVWGMYPSMGFVRGCPACAEVPKGMVGTLVVSKVCSD